MGPRTQGVSGNIPLADLFQNTPSAAVLSTIGDSYLSYRGGSGSGDLGNPGVYTPYVRGSRAGVLALLAVGVFGFLAYGWRKSKQSLKWGNEP